MHVPDGFFEPATAAGAAVVAAGGCAVAVRRSRDVLAERQVPLAGLTPASIFAVQMITFAVAAGTSGHLFGGVLAAVLVGPWTGALCVAVVLLVQVLFADGGITALGLNVVLVALVPAYAGYGMFLGLRAVLGRRAERIALASGLAAVGSVVAAAVVFSLLYAIGGAGGVSLGTLTASMVSVHVLIGIGEGIITALTVGAVLASRPDLVHGASGGLPADTRLAGSPT